jgi:hypothetical protein
VKLESTKLRLPKIFLKTIKTRWKCKTIRIIIRENDKLSSSEAVVKHTHLPYYTHVSCLDASMWDTRNLGIF